MGLLQEPCWHDEANASNPSLSVLSALAEALMATAGRHRLMAGVTGEDYRL